MKEDKRMNNEALDLHRVIVQNNNKSVHKTSYLFAFAGICGGIAAILAGFIFIIIHTALQGDTTFDEIGTILMIGAIPLMFLGGHFMDKSMKTKQ